MFKYLKMIAGKGFTLILLVLLCNSSFFQTVSVGNLKTQKYLYNNSSFLHDTNIQKNFSFDSILVNELLSQNEWLDMKGSFRMRNKSNDSLYICIEAKWNGMETHYQNVSLFSDIGKRQIKNYSSNRYGAATNNILNTIYEKSRENCMEDKAPSHFSSRSGVLAPGKSFGINFVTINCKLYDQDTVLITMENIHESTDIIDDLFAKHDRVKMVPFSLGYIISLYCLNINNPQKSFIVQAKNFEFYFYSDDIDNKFSQDTK